MADRSAVYRVTSQTRLTPKELNRRFLDINARLDPLELQRLTEDEAMAVVLDRVLSRSEAVIASLRGQLLAITQLQWLTATSTTPAALVEAGELYLTVDATNRELFAPGPFAILTRAATPDAYAVVRTLAYDRLTGQWDIKVEALAGLEGEHDDWLIAAIAGSTLAQLTLLEEGRAVRDATLAAAEGVAGVGEQLALVEAARDDALGYRNQAETHRNDALAAAEAAGLARDDAQLAAASVELETILAAAAAADTVTLRRARALAIAL
ncbi:hypothetical protein [Phenylobacterium sp.]|uniref:hypothetical protein n=1 Tax=Phenylobacterium sp. TaxID=1871053 RepID=UPI00301CAF0B